MLWPLHRTNRQVAYAPLLSNMFKRNALIAFFAAHCCVGYIFADIKPAPLFCDHAVLQQEMPIPVWGTASPGENVTAVLNGAKAQGVANKDGKWSMTLPPQKAGGPFSLEIRGNNRLTFEDILIGEVWICSGQSNMERQLGLREGQKPIVNWKEEAAAANFPQIRHFGVAQTKALQPQATVQGNWVVCTPETVTDFTAVGFFFGRALYQARSVPIGLIHSSWGGTPAEAWTSAQGLRTIPSYSSQLDRLVRVAADPVGSAKHYFDELNEWHAKNDAGSRPGAEWYSSDVSTFGWSEMKIPALWETAGLPDFDGVVWFRKSIDLPDDWKDSPATIYLGPVDDIDATWINGHLVGHLENWNTPRIYQVPAGVLKAGKNEIAVRVLDTSGGGGIWGNQQPLELVSKNESVKSVSLGGTWRYKVGVKFSADAARPPLDLSNSPNGPTLLYNGMIAPLVPYAVRGVIWYQGEANADRAHEYRTLFPALIEDWRRLWQAPNLPFLFVQIAPFKGMNPEIREAQLLTAKKVPNTAMVVTLDVGDANDIHPAQKRPVGERLSLAARAVAYGEKIEYSGPEYASANFQAEKAIIHFTHVDGGLAAKNGALIGFSIAGSDRVFRPANASIEGETVVVATEDGIKPVAVRYAWGDAPEGNLFNQADLPASPFRTDVAP